MSEIQMRLIEREMATGDYSNLERYARILARRHAIETPVRISATDMKREIPVDLCYNIPACYCNDYDTDFDLCSNCVAERAFVCPGCLACLAPHIYFGNVRGPTILMACRYRGVRGIGPNGISCVSWDWDDPCLPCQRMKRWRNAIATIRRLRS